MQIWGKGNRLKNLIILGMFGEFCLAFFRYLCFDWRLY